MAPGTAKSVAPADTQVDWQAAIKSAAFKVHRRFPQIDLDELMSMACLAVVQAAARYEGDRGAALETWITYKAPFLLMDMLRLEGHMPRKHIKWRRPREWTEAAVEQYFYTDDHSRHTPPLSNVPDKRPEDCSFDFEELLVGLDEVDRTCVTLHYKQGLTFKQVGEYVGVSESRVSQRVTEALHEQRRRLKGKHPEFEGW